MRIRAFSKNVEFNELEDYRLKNCRIVIDGQNYFYNLYQTSNLPYQFGCEADRYAEYLKEHLSMYKKAKVRCYIIFKGGHENKDKALKIDKQDAQSGYLYDPNEPTDHIVMPVFMKTVYKQVLKEMRLDYAVCQFESKQECIALAQKLKCPIISNDIEFCFSGVPYIPSTTLTYDDTSNSIQCGIFHYDTFIQKYQLTKEKLALFICLTDEKLGFPEGSFNQLFRDLKFPYSPLKRNERLLQWLAVKNPGDASNLIMRYLDSENQKKLKEEIDYFMDFICRNEIIGIPGQYLLNGNRLIVEERDPKWLEKGVALGNITIRYVNLYHWDFILGSWCIEDRDADNAMLLSFDIIAYAYSLMTNFTKDKVTFLNNNFVKEYKDIAMMQKPPYKAENSPFENGWDHIKDLQLFEHFMTQSLQGVNFAALDSLPEDAKLLILALVYFSRRKADSTTREVYSILLSYVMLGVVFGKVNKSINNVQIKKKPILDAITDKDLVNETDCRAANLILMKYFTLNKSELQEIFNKKLIHPFVEFQHCLQQINNLNELCGMPYKTTAYHRTYNGTFVYKFFYDMREISGDAAMSFIEDKLSAAPTVLAFLTGLIEVYNELMYK